jgi:hypothetical protein
LNIRALSPGQNHLFPLLPALPHSSYLSPTSTSPIANHPPLAKPLPPIIFDPDSNFPLLSLSTHSPHCQYLNILVIISIPILSSILTLFKTPMNTTLMTGLAILTSAYLPTRAVFLIYFGWKNYLCSGFELFKLRLGGSAN